MDIRVTNPDHPGVEELLNALDSYLMGRYPPETNHIDSVDELRKDNVVFLAAYNKTEFGKDEILACGAVKFLHHDIAYGEIKRVFVAGSARGRGLAKAIMLKLEGAVRKKGVETIRLEAGTRQPEALNLYHSLGYKQRSSFGAYEDNTLSVFMEKQL